MLRILHFADAHIDIANHGRHDPATGLPLRILDFLSALDHIVDTAIAEKVDLVLFAGDAYKDRTPVPTFQREWGKRIMRLSQAGIRTLMLVGNHDLSPAAGRAHALQEFDTLEVPHTRVIGSPSFLGPEDLEGLPLQVIALPWIARSSMIANLEMSTVNTGEIYSKLEERVGELVNNWLESADPNLPVVLLAHASIQGAVYGGERMVMLGNEIVLPGSLVRDRRLDYVALGHIHKAQNMNKGNQPPVIYPGSIERVDFGEAADDKFFVVANVAKGNTDVEWRPIEGRRFIDCHLRLKSIRDLEPDQSLPGIANLLGQDHQPNGAGLPSTEQLLARLIAALPQPEECAEAIIRLTVEYPRSWDSLVDETALRKYTESAFEFHLVRRPQMQARMRLPGQQAISSLSPLELLDQYWKTVNTPPDEASEINQLARDIIYKISQIGDGDEQPAG